MTSSLGVVRLVSMRRLAAWPPRRRADTAVATTRTLGAAMMGGRRRTTALAATMEPGTEVDSQGEPQIVRWVSRTTQLPQQLPQQPPPTRADEAQDERSWDMSELPDEANGSSNSGSGTTGSSNSSSNGNDNGINCGGSSSSSSSSNSSSNNNNNNSSSNSNSIGAINNDTPLLSTSFDKKSKMLLRGTEFDARGNVKTVAGMYLKSELCSLHDLQPRDLRTIDNYRNQLPSILVRPSTLVVNLEHIKALIKADMVVLFDTDAVDKHNQSMFVFDLQERLRTASPSSGGLSFELRAVEAILLSVCNVLRDQFNQLSPKVNALLRKLEGDLDRSTMVSVLEMSKKLTRFEVRVNAIQDAIMEILNSDEDMAGMYLTTKVNTGQSQPSNMHQEVEFMFEFYGKQIEEISSMTSELISHIRTTQSVVKITLDSQRNSLLLLELKITMGTFAVSFGALGCSAFGMNLISGLEGSPIAFYVAASTSGVAAISAFTLLIRRMRRVVRGIRA